MKYIRKEKKPTIMGSADSIQNNSLSISVVLGMDL